MTYGVRLVVEYRGYVRHSAASGLFVSWCPLLDIMSQGRTRDEAEAALDDSVKLFVDACWRRNILPRVLSEREQDAIAGPGWADYWERRIEIGLDTRVKENP